MIVVNDCRDVDEIVADEGPERGILRQVESRRVEREEKKKNVVPMAGLCPAHGPRQLKG